MRTGGCYCGAIRYEVDGDLGPLVNCHCRSCRRAHGAAFATVGMVRRSDLRVVQGDDQVREFRSGEGFRGFCGRCGGRLYSRPESTPELLMLVASTLDQEPTDPPVMHINLESKAPWFRILDDAPRFDALPPAAAKWLGTDS